MDKQKLSETAGRMMNEVNSSLYSQIRQILLDAQNTVARAVNLVMVQAYFEIGRLIVEDEQHGETRAGYGEETLAALSRRLKAEFGNGFSVRNLRNMRTFYVTFKNRQTLSAKLSWSHYILLMRLDDEQAHAAGLGATIHRKGRKERKAAQQEPLCPLCSLRLNVFSAPAHERAPLQPAPAVHPRLSRAGG